MHPRDLERLSFLIRLRSTGMPIAAMRRFAALRTEGEAGREGRLALLLDHPAAVRARIDHLSRNLHTIDLKIDRRRRILRQQGALPMPQIESLPGPRKPMVEFALLPVHHVQLAIPSGGEARCRAFWGAVLGMDELEKPPVLAARGGCWFRGGDLEIRLGVEDPFAPARKAHPGLLVRGIHQLAGHLDQAGYPVTWGGEFPGHDRFYSVGPFGNRLEFLEPRSH